MRNRLRICLYVIFALLLLCAAWLWWNRPLRADMAAYVPADALLYLEANSLPDVLTGLTSTDAWQALARPAGLKTDFNSLSRLSRAVAWTGIGPAESVVLARAQVAIVVMGLDAAEETEQALHIKPRVALVIETHTSKWRAQATLEKMIGDYARRTYGDARMERKASDNVTFVTWPNPHGGLPIIAAFIDTTVIVGNDETAVQACLAVQRGTRAALTSDPQLGEMRERMRADDALAFGYAPQAGLHRLVAVAALAYAGRLADDPKVQSAAAIILPQLTDRLIGSAAWSESVAHGAVADTYYVTVNNGLPPRFREALMPADMPPSGVAPLLPSDVYQLSRYDYRQPEIAWRELQALISSQLDITYAILITRFLDTALKPFGIAAPREFLSAAGPELATVRLDGPDAGLLLVAQVRDREALRAQVKKQLGNVRIEHVGAAELWISTSDEETTAAFVADYLLLGGLEDVRRCLAAQAAAHIFATSEAYKQASRYVATDAPAGVITYTDDRAAAHTLIALLARQKVLRTNSAPDEASLQRELNLRAYAVSETRPVAGGFERRTLSAFGLSGVIAGQLAAEGGK
ncbi:MAG: hypothetical protein ACJ74W_08240 [Pyrinomonadaceae bacterium]